MERVALYRECKTNSKPRTTGLNEYVLTFRESGIEVTARGEAERNTGDEKPAEVSRRKV